MGSIKHNINMRSRYHWGITINIYFSAFLGLILFNDVADVRDQLQINWKVVIVAYSKFYPDTWLQK